MMTVGRKQIPLFGRFIACINTYLHAKLKKMICQGKCVKLTSNQVCLSKPLKIDPQKRWEMELSSNLKYLQLL